MATIRKRGAKWQVQIRRVGVRPISRSFHVHKDAEAWARQMEVQADRRDLPSDPKSLQRLTLGQLVERYRDTVSVRKRGYDVERIVLNAFLRHRICRKPLGLSMALACTLQAMMVVRTTSRLIIECPFRRFVPSTILGTLHPSTHRAIFGRPEHCIE